jgi:hypothetical protein
MWKGNIVVDAVGHAYDFTPENRVEDCAVEVYDAVASYTHTEVHAIAESEAPGFQLSYEEYVSPWPADEVYFERELRTRVGALDGVESLRIERDRDYDWDESEIAPAARARLRRRRSAAMAGVAAR